MLPVPGTVCGQRASGSVLGLVGSIRSMDTSVTLPSGPNVTVKLLRFRNPVKVNCACQGVPEARIRRMRSPENWRRVVHVRVGLSSGNVDEVVLTEDPGGLVIAIKRSCPSFAASLRSVQDTQPLPLSITSSADIPGCTRETMPRAGPRDIHHMNPRTTNATLNKKIETLIERFVPRLERRSKQKLLEALQR